MTLFLAKNDPDYLEKNKKCIYSTENEINKEDLLIKVEVLNIIILF